jgi:hypothetical protein
MLMNVEIVDSGQDGDSLYFKVVDLSGKEYIIYDCKIKETFGEYKGYYGSYKGRPAHLNILSKDKVVLLIKDENLSNM